jgi:endonuclease/exonuclease/phosphatase family metal-dependent hydrolase
VRVVSYNVRGLRRGSAVARVLRELDADVVGLQEPGGGLLGRLRLRLLCHRTGLRTVVTGRGSTALLAAPRVPAAAAVSVALPRGRRTRRRPFPAARVASLAELGGLQVTVLHLGLTGAERVRQVDRLDALWAGRGPDLVLADLNETPGAGASHALLQRLHDAGRAAGPTFPAGAPRHRIDVALHGAALHPRGVQVPGGPLVARASDHRPVVLDLDR